MVISLNGISFIKKWERFVPDAYKDPVTADGLPITIGYGATRWLDGKKIELGQTISEPDAHELLMKQIATREYFVNRHISAELTQNQFDALVSFVYNVGVGNFYKSTLLARVNKNPWDLSIADQFIKWKNASQQPVRGLLLRRLEEATIFFTK